MPGVAKLLNNRQGRESSTMNRRAGLETAIQQRLADFSKPVVRASFSGHCNVSKSTSTSWNA